MNAEHIFRILLIIHITGGTISFLVAPVALIVKKGGAQHRLWGKIFFWSMTVVATTALIMAPMHSELFLTLVGVFSFYLEFSGYRALYRKDVYKTKRTAAIDWIVVIANTLFSGYLLILGISNLNQPFGIIAGVFGLIGTRLSIADIRNFIRPSPDKTKWFTSHMINMIAAYIAALSAFSAVNLNFEGVSPLVVWLWPTVVGVPLLVIWVNSYKKKFRQGKKIREQAIVTIKSDFSD